MARRIIEKKNSKHHLLTRMKEKRGQSRERERDSSVRVYRKQKGRQSMMSTRDDESF